MGALVAGWPPVAQVFVAALLTAVATGLGAIPFAFLREMSARTIARANAVAAGLMLGASFGLLTEGATLGGGRTAIGALAGVALILITQRLLGDHEPDLGTLQGAGARRVLLVVVVMTVHSFAEGVAVGVSFGGGETLAVAITLAIAVHNVPEGLAISAVMRPRGASVPACAGWSVFSSLPQPLTAVPAYLFVEQVRPAMPYGLGFAAGAMVYMVLVELLPEAFEEGDAAQVAGIAGLTMVGMLLFQRRI